MHQHIVSAFSNELDHLSASLLGMGGLAEEMIIDAARAVLSQDDVLARSVIERDKVLDQQERETERHLIRLLALRQPMASDLRMVIGGIKISGTIERIGGLAKNTAWRSLDLKREPDPVLARGLKRMGDAVSRLMHVTLDALSRKDAEMAQRVIEQDDDIDSHQDALLRSLLSQFAEDPDSIDTRVNYLFIVKNLERIGDHCTNIAKTVHYIATGETVAETDGPAIAVPTALDETEDQG